MLIDYAFKKLEDNKGNLSERRNENPRIDKITSTYPLFNSAVAFILFVNVGVRKIYNMNYEAIN